MQNKKIFLLTCLAVILGILLCACDNQSKEYKLSKIKMYGSDGSYEGEILVDKHGNQTQTSLEMADGKVSLTNISYIYDSHGNYVIREYKNETTSFKEEFVYEYDES